MSSPRTETGTHTVTLSTLSCYEGVAGSVVTDGSAWHCQGPLGDTYQLRSEVYVEGTVGLQESKHSVEEVQWHRHLGRVVIFGGHLDWDGGLGEVNDITSYALHDGLQGQETAQEGLWLLTPGLDPASPPTPHLGTGRDPALHSH